MTAHHAIPSTPRRHAPTTTRRSAAVGIAVAFLIAAGGYGAARTLGLPSAPEGASTVSPSTQAMRELHDTAVHLYGPQLVPATNPDITPGNDVMREQRETTIALYAPGR
jgi:hypothetical protein